MQCACRDAVLHSYQLEKSEHCTAVQVASDFAFIPFGGGARKCVGDQFALMEATVAIAMLLRWAFFGVPGWLLTSHQASGKHGLL